MFIFTLKRLLSVIPILLGITIVAYFLTRTIPGDVVAVMLGTNADPEVAAQLRRNLRLDQPVIIGYFDWLVNVLQGNLGESIRSGLPIGQDLAVRFGRTAQLTLAAIILAVSLSIPLGILAAVRRNRAPDQVISITALLGISVPDFWLGTLLILVFALKLGWLPPAGYVAPSEDPSLFLKLLILPAITLGFQVMGILTRFTRGAMLEVLNQDFVRTARAKGAVERSVLYRHALRNALIPVVTVIGLNVGFLLSGTIIVETIFGWPGVGSLAITAINQRDYPVVQACVMLFALTFTLVNLIVDLLYGLIDARIRYS
ncbi:ABC transporter permease [Deinococcus peraridilitoris]|uniref:ABC-type dipeptide/oligopeptide/nickel transport system, permease component n=1 Tax=Deinococcus peraridilitoris (strain DSM 19664 / LMG 22246 / CIP 109416 / KR-200) TaxID=937777 RepID=L0A8D9_DEIPD|nr:ABC transporter permease [Deinococcus peraridilitoris]AFZ69447.1 ABC-type dipeptide/oligopeptide/nickel transport system, permease component [Deinococcus peraridilitoris DSM 19664]